MIFTQGYTLFAGSNCPEHIQEAKDYISRNNLTRDDVKLLSNDDEVLVITKRNVKLIV